MKGSSPYPELVVALPSRLPGPHCHGAPGGGSAHAVTVESRAATPAGSVVESPVRRWSASGLTIDSVKPVKAPACLLVEPAVNDGASGRAAPGQALPPGPEVIWNVVDACLEPPLDGTKSAVGV